MREIKSIMPAPHYRLRLELFSGAVHNIDISDELHGIKWEPLQKIEKFNEVFYHDGDALWPSGVCLSESELMFKVRQIC